MVWGAAGACLAEVREEQARESVAEPIGTCRELQQDVRRLEVAVYHACTNKHIAIAIAVVKGVLGNIYTTSNAGLCRVASAGG